MDGVRRIRFSKNIDKVIRAFAEFDKLVEYTNKFRRGRSKNVKIKSNGITRVIKSDDEYQKVLNNSGFKPIEVIIEDNIGKKRNKHPTKEKNPKKLTKLFSSADISRNYQKIMCFPISLRTIQIVNLESSTKKKIKSEVFSKTSRTLCIGNSIILTGGRIEGRQVYEISLKTYELKKIQSLNFGRYWHSMGFIDGNPAVIGGVEGEKKNKKSLRSVEVFKSGKWTVYPPLNISRANTSCSWYNSKTFVLWGSTYKNGDIGFRKDLEIFESNSWNTISCSISSFYNSASLALSSTSILILGGLIENDFPYNKVYLFNTEKNTYQTLATLKYDDYFPYGQTTLISNQVYLSGSKHGIFTYDLSSALA